MRKVRRLEKVDQKVTHRKEQSERYLGYSYSLQDYPNSPSLIKVQFVIGIHVMKHPLISILRQTR